MQAISAKNGKNKKVQLDGKESGCDFYINSSDHNYCFWQFSKTLTSPLSDKEICQLLGISQLHLREDYNSSISKLKEIKDEPDMKEFMELILEKIRVDKNLDIFVLNDGAGDVNDSGSEKSESEEEIRASIEAIKKRRKGKSNSAQPLHRDGKKTDLYSLNSKKKKK